ncbi:MAG: DUF2959 domain-containing protein, partial [Planctomycetota bacterium]|nr:DUF2959 domain-containing protein [Planctomycetota bacterium]
ADHKGPAQVDSLVSSIEQVYVNSEIAKQQIKVAYQNLATITSSDFEGDAVTAYNEFVLTVKASEKQAEKLRGSVEPMKKLAGPVFEQWAKDLASYQSTTMRQRSQARLAATRERYDAVVAAADPVLATYDLFNRNLQDHVLYLSHDLNPAALADVQNEVKKVKDLTIELDDGFTATMVAARRYVDAAALPATGEPDGTEDDPKVVAVSGEKATAGKK